MGGVAAKSASVECEWSPPMVEIATAQGLCKGEIEDYVKSCEQRRRSPLHEACAAGNAEAVKALLDVMDRDFVDLKDERGETAFGIAFFAENVACVEVLASCTKIAGARLLVEPLSDLMPRSSFSGRRVSFTALHTMLQAEYLSEMSLERLLPLVPSRCLRVVGPDQHTLAHAMCAPPVLGKDALKYCSEEKEERVSIAKVLIPLLSPQTLRAPDSLGRTPLQLSVSWSQPKITELLLDRIGDASICDRVAGGGTALHHLGTYSSTEENRRDTATLILRRAPPKALYCMDREQRSIVHVLCSRNQPSVLRICAENHPSFVREMLSTGDKWPLWELCSGYECSCENFEIIWGIMEGLKESEKLAILTEGSPMPPSCMSFKNKTLSKDTVEFIISRMPVSLLKQPLNTISGSALHMILETAPPWIRSSDSLPLLSSLLEKIGVGCLQETEHMPPPLMLAVRAGAYYWAMEMLHVTPCSSIRYRDSTGASLLHKISREHSEGTLEFLVTLLEMASETDLLVTNRIGASWIDNILVNDELSHNINHWFHLVPDKVIAKSQTFFDVVTDWMTRKQIPCHEPPVCTVLDRLFQTVDVEGQSALTEFLSKLCAPGCSKEVLSAILSCIPTEAFSAALSNGDTFLHRLADRGQVSYGNFAEVLSFVPAEVLCMANERSLTAYDVAVEAALLPDELIGMLRVPVKNAACT